MDVHHMCVYVIRVQKKIMNPKDLKLQMIDSYHVVSGNRTKGSARAEGSLNCRTISPATTLLSYIFPLASPL